jgi:hypothetical protein
MNAHGPNTITITEIAEWYATAPSADIIGQQSWAHLAAYVTERLALHLCKGLLIIPTPDPEPYASATAQGVDIARNKRLRVSTAYCDHPIWPAHVNVAYRVWHDVEGHGPGPDAFPFTVAGELLAWELSAGDLPAAALPAAFTETVGQLAYAAVTGDFGEQRAVIPPAHWLTATIVDDRPQSVTVTD